MGKPPDSSAPDRTPATLYCDESGNTGSNLNDPDQPFYVLAGLVVPEGAAPAVEDLVNRLRPDAAIRSAEVKAAVLMNSSRGRQAIGRFLTEVFEVHTALFVGVYEKRFGICARIVDDCFDGAYNSRVDIRLTGDPLGKQRIANRLYRALGDDSLRTWADAWRKGDRNALVAATKGLSAALRKVREKDLAFKIDGSLENIDEWLPKPSAVESINLPVWVATFMQVEYFCEAAGLGPVEIVHDEITRFDSAYQEVLAIFKRGTPYVHVGPHGTPFVSGLRRLTTYQSASSKSSLLLQAADVIASASCLFLKRTAKDTSLHRSLEPIDTFLRRLSFISTLVIGVKHIDWMIAEPTLAHLANRQGQAVCRDERAGTGLPELIAPEPLWAYIQGHVLPQQRRCAMWRMVVAGIVLACAAFISGGAVQGQRQVGIEAAPTRTATPVEVINFPAVQGVSGAVNVGNLPAVQAVSGNVQVTNLPLDADGNVRVSCPGGGTRQAYMFVQIANAMLISELQANGTAPFPVAGWRNVQVLFRINAPPGAQACDTGVLPQFGAGNAFATAWVVPRTCTPFGQSATAMGGGPVLGPEIRFRADGSSVPSATTFDLWLYLTD